MSFSAKAKGARLAAQDFAKLLKFGRDSRVAAVLRPDRRSDWVLARLLLHVRQPVTFLTTPNGAELAARDSALASADIHPIIEDHQACGDDGNDAKSKITSDSDRASDLEPDMTHSRTLRAAARWAVLNDVRHIALGDTRTCGALSAIARMDGGDRGLCVSGLYANGLEGLPPGVVNVHAPLAGVPENVVDSSYESTSSTKQKRQQEQEKQQSSLLLPSLPTEVARAAILLSPATHTAIADNEDVVDIILRAAQRRRDAMRFLVAESDDAVRACVLEASHWGYVVVRRSAFTRWWADTGANMDAIKGGRHVAVHAMARIIAHVSGAAVMPQVDDEHVARLTGMLLATVPRPRGGGISSIDGGAMPNLAPLPKGRTAGGIVVRPATGRFAKRVLQASRQSEFHQHQRQQQQGGRYRGGRQQQHGRRGGGGRGTGNRHGMDSGGRGGFNMDAYAHPDDLMIITREPDHESGSLLATRMRGTRACAALGVGASKPVYWDHRFVMCAVPVDDFASGGGDRVTSSPDTSAFPLAPRDVYAAVLDDPPADPVVHDKKLTDAQLYVRQLRRADWERITAITTRVRDFQVPYECIRALPAIVQKPEQSTSLGHFVASPHLGISARPDLCFAAVRMPRFRTLPHDIDPGFQAAHLDHIHPKQGRNETPPGEPWRRQQQEHQRYSNRGNERRTRPFSKKTASMPSSPSSSS